MPNKTIYISDKDVELFNEAKRIAGKSVSSVIVDALRVYVNQAKRRDGMDEIRVKVGPKNDVRTERFVGERLFGWSGVGADGAWVVAEAFLTSEGRIAAYVRYWPQERFAHMKPDGASLYVDNLEGTNFRFISDEFAAMLMSFKDEYVAGVRSDK